MLPSSFINELAYQWTVAIHTNAMSRAAVNGSRTTRSTNPLAAAGCVRWSRTLRAPAWTLLEVVFFVELFQCHVAVAEVLHAPAEQTEGKQAGGDEEGAGAPPAEQPPLLVERPPTRWWRADSPEDAETDEGQGEQGGQDDPRPGRHAFRGAAVRRAFDRIEQTVGPSVVLREHPQPQGQQKQTWAGEHQRSHAGRQQQPAEDLQPDASRLRGRALFAHLDSMSNGRDEPQSTVPDGKAGREPGCAANELFKAVL